MYIKLIAKSLIVITILSGLTVCHAQDDGKATNKTTLDSPFDTVAIIGVENETYLETNKVFHNENRVSIQRAWTTDHPDHILFRTGNDVF